ncbi:NAD-dependent epimerase/dehydratase [Leptolyngbya sp. NIES-2104]|nr:NAD-dependent epimerase/dehydratase [Leptolyngbya sp. NIES-2104]
MRVFITGATGFIGSAIVQELLNVGYQVVGLARNDAAAKALAQMGVEVHRGDLSDTQSLIAGVRDCDGIIHTAFVHDFSDYAGAGETDRRAVEAMGNAIAGSGRPFVITSGTVVVPPGGIATEDDAGDPSSVAAPRVASEEAVLAMASRGVRASVVRLPPSVHGDGDHGFIPALISIAREKGVSAYVNDGLNRWCAVHRLDAAHLFRLALEKGSAGAIYHGVADEGVPVKQIAEVVGRRLNVPTIAKSSDEAADHFGWLAHFLSADCPASSVQTQKRLGWHPTQPALIPDLDQSSYFEI